MFDYEAVLITELRERHPGAYVAVHNPTVRGNTPVGEAKLPRITIQRSGGQVGRFTEQPLVTTRVAAPTQLEALDLIRTVCREYFDIRDEVADITKVINNAITLVSSTSYETMYQVTTYFTLNV